jgi:hypothetical protein
MKLFSCQVCGNVLYFENHACGQCRHRLGYAPELETLLALDADGSGFRSVIGGTRRFHCVNAAQGACNWLVPEGAKVAIASRAAITARCPTFHTLKICGDGAISKPQSTGCSTRCYAGISHCAHGPKIRATD